MRNLLVRRCGGFGGDARWEKGSTGQQRFFPLTETVSHYCPVIIPWPFCKRLPAGMKGKSFLHDLRWGLAAYQTPAKRNTWADFEQCKAGNEDCEPRYLERQKLGEMVIPSFSLPLFFQQLLPHDTTGLMIGSMLSPPPGSVSWLVMTFCMFNLGKKKIRIFSM